MFIISANAQRARSYLLILTSAVNNNKKELLSGDNSNSVRCQGKTDQKVTQLQ